MFHSLFNRSSVRSFKFVNSLKNSFLSTVSEATSAPTLAENVLIETTKKNIAQSPLKMRFLVMLARGMWVPDALAQMKFSPKHRAVEISQMIQRCCALAKLRHNAIPEQLRIKEIYVTKGLARKKIRFHGRGRHGVGMIRKSHVTVKVESIDFKKAIESAKTPTSKLKWVKREALVNQLKLNPRVPRVPYNERLKQERKASKNAAV